MYKESHRQDGRQNMPDHVAAGSMFENAHNINIHGGTYVATGRDVIYNIVNNYAPRGSHFNQGDSSDIEAVAYRTTTYSR